MSNTIDTAIKDHGAKREFGTGSHRDVAKGKGRMDLIPAVSVLRVYDCICDCENQEDVSVQDYLEYALIEGYKYLSGEDSEDYLAKAARACLIALGMYESELGDADGNRVECLSDVRACLAFGLKQVSIHYESGAEKYGENNWQLGQPLSVLLDSGLRHVAKGIGNIVDEPHIRAAAWNFLCAIWMEIYRPEMQNIETRKSKL